jgi:biotin carboxyl carrier protein
VAIIEAMKLENEIQSAFEGKVVDILVSAGSDIRNKDAMIVLE